MPRAVGRLLSAIYYPEVVSVQKEHVGILLILVEIADIARFGVVILYHAYLARKAV